jgi:hypothetical protein
MIVSSQEKKRLLHLLSLTLILIFSFVSSGCNRTTAPINPDDYVEIDNPVLSDNPSENGKVWVPRSSLAQGVPRGGDLAKRGYDAAVGKGTVVESARQGTLKTDRVRHRLLLAAESGSPLDRKLFDLLKYNLNVRSAGRAVPVSAATEEEKQDFVKAVSSQAEGGPLLLLSAAEGLKAGAAIKAELYDSRGPFMFRSITVKIPAPEQDETLNEAVQRALSGLAGAIQDLAVRLPWYARVVAISGDRVYLDSGAESGLKPGQKLVVYRGGEVIKGIGFAPGERILAGIAVNDLVGLDGSYATSVEAQKVKPGDYVELEK